MRIIALLLFLAANCYSAEFLIAAKNSWMIDADQTGWTQEQVDTANRQYKIGDIVGVYPDGKLSDNAQANGAFYLVRVAGLSYEAALKYKQEWIETYIENGVTKTRMVNRRRYRIRAQDLPLSVRNTLRDTHVYNTTLAAVRTYIRNKETGLNE